VTRSRHHWPLRALGHHVRAGVLVPVSPDHGTTGRCKAVNPKRRKTYMACHPITEPLAAASSLLSPYIYTGKMCHPITEPLAAARRTAEAVQPHSLGVSPDQGTTGRCEDRIGRDSRLSKYGVTRSRNHWPLRGIGDVVDIQLLVVSPDHGTTGRCEGPPTLSPHTTRAGVTRSRNHWPLRGLRL